MSTNDSHMCKNPSPQIKIETLKVHDIENFKVHTSKPLDVLND